MGSFADSVGHLQPTFKEMVTRPELAAFITGTERLAEADAVDGCVRRAVIGELDPTGQLAISRFRMSPFAPPGLTEHLHALGRFEACDDAARAAIAEAVRRTLALGWLYVCSPEAHIVPSRSDLGIWVMWAPSLKAVELGQVIDKRLAKKITGDGQRLLRSELKQIGVLGFRGRIRVGEVGIQLVTLGAFLRMIQTDEVHDETIAPFKGGVHPQTLEGEDPGQWAWSRYPEESRL